MKSFYFTAIILLVLNSAQATIHYTMISVNR